MPLLGMLASSLYVFLKYPHLNTYNHRTDTESNIHSPPSSLHISFSSASAIDFQPSLFKTNHPVYTLASTP